MNKRTEKKTLRVRLAVWLIKQLPKLLGFGVQFIRQDARRGGLHHAPACGANHYHHTRPITYSCTCGAEYYWRKEYPLPGVHDQLNALFLSVKNSQRDQFYAAVARWLVLQQGKDTQNPPKDRAG